MKKHLISFGSCGYENTLIDLKNSAKNYFDSIRLYNEKDIEFLINNFNNHFKNGRGYGYWIWKPYIILEEFKNMGEDDTLMYVDSTTVFTSNPKPLLDKTDEKDIILFSSKYRNVEFTKYDTFYHMGCLDNKFVFGPHLNAAMILLKKTNSSVDFIKEYFELCKDYHILSDEPNKEGNNFKEFVDHRHDQSILSLLSIKNNIELFRDPSQWGEKDKSLFTNSDYQTMINHHRYKH